MDSIAFENSLTPNWRQAVFWTNNVLVYLGIYASLHRWINRWTRWNEWLLSLDYSSYRDLQHGNASSTELHFEYLLHDSYFLEEYTNGFIIDE